MKLPKIFGLPPGSALSNPIIEASMPITRISPQIPKFSKGLNLFKLKSAWKSEEASPPSYTSLLNDLGFEPSSDHIYVAFQADNFPTDTFSNEYGASFLESLTSMTQGIGDIAQMFGSRNMGQVMGNMSGALTSLGEDVGGGVGTAANMAGSFLGKVGQGGDKLKELATKHAGTTTGSILSTVSSMMAGARVDFPQVWKNSGFQPSYSMTVRLFNPNPSDIDTTQKYIIGPIAALMLLAVPISEDGNVYNWPFLHKIKCPGIYDLNPAFISNITIVKGGEQHQIAYNQRLGVVDVRIDFGSLYNSMIAVKGGKGSDRPTVKSYIDVLKGEKTVSGYQIHNPDPGIPISEIISSVITSKYPSLVTSGSTISTSTPERVDSDDSDIYDGLESDMPIDI